MPLMDHIQFKMLVGILNLLFAFFVIMLSVKYSNFKNTTIKTFFCFWFLEFLYIAWSIYIAFLIFKL
jgi:hypothetical protein